MSFVYILKSLRDDNFYIGSAENLEKRMRQHAAGHTQTTRNMGEIKLVFSQKYDTLLEARRVETKLKKLKRRDYIEKIVADGYIKIKP